MVLFAERILTPHQHRGLMLFAGNDVKVEAADSSPEEVASVVREIICVSKSHLPNAPDYIIEVTPTESRFAAWDKTRKINAALREVALTTDNTWCVITAEHFLNIDGTPRKEHFIDDKLHLNEQGYQKWAELIKEQLETFVTVEETNRRAPNRNAIQRVRAGDSTNAFYADRHLQCPQPTAQGLKAREQRRPVPNYSTHQNLFGLHRS